MAWNLTHILRQSAVFGFVVALTFTGVCLATQLNFTQFSDVIAAEVSAHSMSREEIEIVLKKRLKRMPQAQVRKLSKEIMILCEKYRFDPAMILSLIHKESTFRIDARSRVGALGLMQVLPTTAHYIAKREKIRSYHQASDLVNPMINVRVGIAYLAYLRERFPHSNQYIAAYNLGPDRLRRMVKGNSFAVERMRNYVFQIRDGIALIRREGTVPALVIAAR